MIKRKSVVLSDTENGTNKKAVMSLEEDKTGVYGTMRLYNFAHELPGISSLGFYVNQKVYKAGLTHKSHMFYEFFIDVKEIPEKFSCAVVNFQNAQPAPILYGSSEGSDEEIYGSIISAMSKDPSIENTKKFLDENGIDFDEDEKKQVEKDIDEAMCNTCEGCTKCIYKNYFYENHVDALKNEENLPPVFDEPQKNNDNVEQIPLPEFPLEETVEKETVFIDRLKPQIDKLFENNPIEDSLQNLIPSSKWVKVEYEEEGDFYVFGLLYDDDENVRYVCYGVPAVFEEEAPKELSGYPIWLPLDKKNSKGFGYWLTYQDASTGEPVRAIID